MANGLAAASDRIRYAILGSIALYFLLYALAAAGVEFAAPAAGVLFGLIAIGLGSVLVHVSDWDGGFDPLAVAGSSLVVAGAAQLGFLVTELPVLSLVSFLGILTGVGLYAYTVWIVD